MPNLRDTLSDHFEGSAFVWQGFKEHPLLSICGLPLLFLNAALLPVSLMASRKDREPRDYRDREPFVLKPERAGYYRYGRYDHGDTRQYDPDQEREPFPGSHNAWPEQDYPEDRHGSGKKKRRKAKIKHESVLYPGWGLPHPWRVQRLRDESSSDLRRTRSFPDDVFDDWYNREYRPLSPGMYSRQQKQLWEQFPNLPQDVHAHARPSPVVLERPSSTGTRGQAQSRTQAPPAPSPLNHPPPIHRDFAQVGDQQSSAGNVPHAPGNCVPPAASTIYSAKPSSRSAPKEPSHVLSSRAFSRRSEHSTARRGTMRNDDVNDIESYVTQSVQSLGTHRSAGSQQTWRKPPSTIHTHPQFKPTYRADSVAPRDSASQQSEPDEDSRHPFEDRVYTNSQRGRSKAPARSSDRPETVNEVSMQRSCTSRASSNGMFRQTNSGNPPLRSPTISTINTAELPDTICGSSKSRSMANRAQSQRTAATRIWRPETRGEKDTDDSASDRV